MKTKLPGVKHHESKVLPHLAEGGTVGTRAKDKAATGTKVIAATRTPDGGQQYVRNNDFRIANNADNAYENRALEGKTVNPKAASGLVKATMYSVNPDDVELANRIGNIASKSADVQNAITRKYGDRKRR